MVVIDAVAHALNTRPRKSLGWRTPAEAYNPLFKAELVRNRHTGRWRGIDDLEIAVAEYVDCFNHRRIHGEIGYVPPAEYEDAHRAQQSTQTTDADLIDAP